MDENPSILSHVSLGTNDVDRASAFYDAVLAPLGYGRLMEHPGAIAYGKVYPEFWIQAPFDGQVAAVGNGTHIAFVASSSEAVHGFYEAAIAAGGTGDGAPGPRPDYGQEYYGCFVRDLDGHKVEACYWATD
ncbi:MAG: VOC family protein [Kaiparowitsia implicata GSE-PSE-MK54-09C]|jgi:catechol 2,3-dioxygenase-like lactoylglutathione lyase family enzyme|nr:VOC family protein [Kaiparowitsia implicata GSE-PSE-MK54-09C]